MTTAYDMLAAANSRLPTVTPQEAFERARSGSCVLLDVREPTEWDIHLAGALQIPRGVLEFQADPTSPRHHAALDPDAEVIVFCRSGVRSALAGATLLDLGFTRVTNMAGGLNAWREAGLPVEDAHADM